MALFKRGLRKCIKLYFRIHFSWPIWYYVINRKPRMLLQSNLPKLTPVQIRLVNDLLEKGIAVTSLQELFPDQPNLLGQLWQYVEEKRKEKNDISFAKPFLRYLWDTHPVLSPSDPFHRLVIDEKILNVANSYLGMFSNFYILMLNVTVPVGDNANPMFSQQWHRDHEDKKLCKIFLYLNDIDEQSGPFIYIPSSVYGKKWGHLFPQEVPKGAYPPSTDLERIIPISQIMKMTGRAGTLIFADTTGLHKGGYAFSKERIMLTAGFRTNASASICKVDRSGMSLSGARPSVRYALTSEVPIAISRVMFNAYKNLRSKKTKKIEMD